MGQFLDAEARTTLARMAQEMVAEDMASLDISVMSELTPRSLALLLVSVSPEMQQQLLAEASALGILRKMRLLLAVQSVNRWGAAQAGWPPARQQPACQGLRCSAGPGAPLRWAPPPTLRRSYTTLHQLRRKYQKRLQELHKQGALPAKEAGPGQASPSKWSAAAAFSSCWQGSKYLSFTGRQASTTSQGGPPMQGHASLLPRAALAFLARQLHALARVIAPAPPRAHHSGITTAPRRCRRPPGPALCGPHQGGAPRQHEWPAAPRAAGALLGGGHRHRPRGHQHHQLQHQQHVHLGAGQPRGPSQGVLPARAGGWQGGLPRGSRGPCRAAGREAAREDRSHHGPAEAAPPQVGLGRRCCCCSNGRRRGLVLV